MFVCALFHRLLRLVSKALYVFVQTCFQHQDPPAVKPPAVQPPAEKKSPAEETVAEETVAEEPAAEQPPAKKRRSNLKL